MEERFVVSRDRDVPGCSDFLQFETSRVNTAKFAAILAEVGSRFVQQFWL